MGNGTDGSGARTSTPSGNRGASRRRPPTATEAFRAQLGLVFRRRGSLAALAVLTALPMTVLAASLHGVGSVALGDLVQATWMVPTLLSVVWPAIVTWKDDAPSGRAYHWTLPVDRARLQLLRAAAGWVHLLTGLAVGITLGWATGASIHDGMAVGRGAVLAAVIPGATVLYLVGTLPALTTDRPLLWLFAAFLAVSGLQGLSMALGWNWLESALTAVFTSGSLSLTAAANLPQAVSGALGGSSVTLRPWQATGLWLITAMGVTVATAHLHLERSGDV